METNLTLWIKKHGNPNPKLPVPSKKELETLYIVERNSTWEIALKYKVSQTQICRWLRYWNIPRRSYKENKMPTKKGGKLSKGHRDRISKALLNNKNSKNGKDHWNWRGGITPINARIRNSKKYKEWRKKVFKRDDWTCQFCGARSKKGKRVRLEADHIKPFSLYPKLRYKVSNGRTLCYKCHNLIGWQLFKDANPRKNL